MVDKKKLPVIKRVWAMPNKRTFQIKPIKRLLLEEKTPGTWLDPFPYPFKEDALIFLRGLEGEIADGILFDPPYSLRQLKENYDSRGEHLGDTTSAVQRRWKDEIARVIKPRGKCISFGWSSGGLGKKRGFVITRILLVNHGGSHNDTIVTVEKKVQRSLLCQKGKE